MRHKSALDLDILDRDATFVRLVVPAGDDLDLSLSAQPERGPIADLRQCVRAYGAPAAENRLLGTVGSGKVLSMTF
jgi:hypothetical protein